MHTVSTLLLAVATTGAVPDNCVLDFTATWCGPCQQMSPIVERLHRQGYPIHKVDIDQHADLKNRFRVESIPAFVLVVNGKEVDRIVGATSDGELKRLLARIPQSEMQTVAETKPSIFKSPFSVKEPKSDFHLTENVKKSESRFQFPFFSRKEKEATAVVYSEPETVRGNNYDEPVASAEPNAPDPMASSVRIRVRDGEGINFGSGTVIASQVGNTLLLTCGHIFRDLSSDAKIEVDLFANGQEHHFVGKLLDFDIEADVGLITVPTSEVIQSSPVAKAGTLVAASDRVYSIGCGGGEVPTRESHIVTALNRYFGPQNIECTGVPIQGRSGGGLFNQYGEIVGVCIAADRKEQRGLYAGTEPIHALLERAGLASLFRSAEQQQQLADASRTETQARPSSLEPAVMTSQEQPAVGQRPSNPADAGYAQQNQQQQPSAAEMEALQNVGEAEVVCIVRQLDKPQAASRVIVINRASPKFLSYLSNELNGQPTPTSDRVETGADAVRDMAQATGHSVVPAQMERYRRSAESR